MLLYEDDPQRRDGFASADEVKPFTARLSQFGVDSYLGTVKAFDGNYGRLYEAAKKNAQLVDNSIGESISRETAYDQRIRQVREATGVTLGNPERSDFYREAQVRHSGMLLRGEISPDDARGLKSFQRMRAELEAGIFNEKVDNLAQSMPDKAGQLTFYQTVNEQGRNMARNASEELDYARQGLNPIVSFGAEAGGTLMGMWRDPVNMIGLTLGAGSSGAKWALSRIFQTAAKEGAINAGLQALTETGVQAWRKEIGVKNGLEPALENIGMAALFGGVFGGAFAAGREAFRPAGRVFTAEERDATIRVLSGQGSVADLEKAAKAMNVEIDAPTQDLLKSLKQAEMDDAGTLPKAPKGVNADDHAEALTAAMQRAADPDSAPPPVAPIIAPERRAPLPVLADDAPAPGRAFTYQDKPVSFEAVSAGELKTAAETFQYKGGGDVEGVTDRLRSVTRWDNLASGKVIVYETADGQRLIADGHQRLGLANKLLREGNETDIRLDAFIFREADGWTPADVRAIAAYKNIREGSGDVLDTARVLRERPDLMDGSLAQGQVHMQQALGLSKLSDDAWGMVLNGAVKPNHAAWVGRIAPEPKEAHAALLMAIRQAGAESENAARFAIHDALQAGFRIETQNTMFGLLETTVSLAPQRSQLFALAMRNLQDDKKLFTTLIEKQKEITDAGNQLAAQANATRAEQADRLAFLLEKAATRVGPISDALNRAAMAVAEGQAPGKASRVFVADVMGIIERDGMAALDAPPAARPSGIEPGTPEAKARADEMLPELNATPRDPDTPDMFGAKPAEISAASNEVPKVSAPEPPARAAGDPNDVIPMAFREDGRDMKTVSISDALDDANQTQMFSDLISGCKL